MRDTEFRKIPDPIPLAGCYTLDLYCDHDNPEHSWGEFPHTYLDEQGSRCRQMAREAGWTFHRDGTTTCPKCNERRKREMT